MGSFPGDGQLRFSIVGTLQLNRLGSGKARDALGQPLSGQTSGDLWGWEVEVGREATGESAGGQQTGRRRGREESPCLGRDCRNRPYRPGLGRGR